MDIENNYQKLLSPFKIKGTEFKNRFIFLPHFTGYGRDSGYLENGLFTERNILHYVERAKGGAAAVTVSQNVDPKSQMDFRYVLGYEKKNGDNFKLLAEEVHRYDCRVITQLNQGGHTTLLNPPQLLVAPTQMNEPYCHFNTKELEYDDLMYIKDYYINSARWQKELGWDGVELKIAHDGLLRSFVSPYFNRREDQYGGDFERRMSYPLEIISGIREEVGENYPIGIRLCVDEFSWYGYSLEYGLKVAKALQDGGVDYISTDAGTFSSWYMQIPPSPLPLGWAIYQAAALKKTLDIPVIAFGRINDPSMAETILKDNNADLIGMCRQLICDPETPNKVMQGREDEIRHCIGCNEACVGVDGIYVECIQNPGVGREKYLGIDTLKPAEKCKNIIVVGGGVAGLKFAEIAARRGHKVEIYERNEKVGGQLLFAEKIPYRNEMEEIYRWLKLENLRLGVTIHYNVLVDEKMIEDMDPEVLVVATGSYAPQPVIPGMEDSTICILTVIDALKHNEKIGNRVLVYDNIGNWQGGGVADYCQRLGAEVTVVCSAANIGVDIESGQSYLLTKRIHENGGIVITNHTLSAVYENTVIVENIYNHKETTIEKIDTLIIADQSKSKNELYKAFKGKRDQVYFCGDAVAPRGVEQIIFEAELLARDI